MPSQSTFSTIDRTRAAMLVSREPDDHARRPAGDPTGPGAPRPGSMHAASVSGLASRAATLRLAFVSAVVALVASFAAVGSTIPLFNVYRAEDGFTNAGISITVVAYSVATLSTLLVLGRLSNHLGRRPLAITSLSLLLLGCLLLLDVHDIGILIAGRVMMGLGAGLASSSLTSYIVDAAPPKPAWLASVASS